MMKFFFPVVCIAAAMLSADDKLPVDEDISLSRNFDFSCDRHKAKEAELLQPPAGEYAFPKNEIIWEDGMTVTYEDLSDDEEPMTALFCFMFYNIFGEDTMSEMIAFEI